MCLAPHHRTTPTTKSNITTTTTAANTSSLWNQCVLPYYYQTQDFNKSNYTNKLIRIPQAHETSISRCAFSLLTSLFTKLKLQPQQRELKGYLPAPLISWMSVNSSFSLFVYPSIKLNITSKTATPKKYLPLAGEIIQFVVALHPTLTIIPRL